VRSVILQVLGTSIFVAGTLALGRWLRRHPTQQRAKRTSRVLHLLFLTALCPPWVVAFFRPRPAWLDRLLGLPSLPRGPLAGALGYFLIATGTYLVIASNLALRQFGQGANVFLLTRRVVQHGIYRHTRNPMSLSLYLACIGLGLASGSTYLTLAALLGVIPPHLFYLKYFEELELELRFGESYRDYRQRVPFLLPGALWNPFRRGHAHG
jgi:protein-S-isoprenylcysteine O-methyltransferase Ste14